MVYIDFVPTPERISTPELSMALLVLVTPDTSFLRSAAFHILQRFLAYLPLLFFTFCWRKVHHSRFSVERAGFCLVRSTGPFLRKRNPNGIGAESLFFFWFKYCTICFFDFNVRKPESIRTRQKQAR